MTIFGHHFLYKLNEWWGNEYEDLYITFLEDNDNIVVQTSHEYIGLAYWIGADIINISLKPTYEHQQTIKVFLFRTLSAFLQNVAVRCPITTYNYTTNQ
jgi:hypothetical protein